MDIESKTPKIRVCIRKRPLTKKEIQKKEKDIVEVEGEVITIKEEKVKLDLTKYVEKHSFEFDNSFSENVDNLEIYNIVVRPLIYFSIDGGKASCFAYG
jgi:kinesin family protein 2/24